MIKIIYGICIDSLGESENTQSMCIFNDSQSCEFCTKLKGNNIRENKRILFTPMLI